MKVLVCGDRYWTDPEPIRREMAKLPPGTLIIHGAARGADTIAGNLAHELGLKEQFFPADLELHGRAAGPIRNMEMLNQKPDEVWAFHPDIESSKGTKHMVTIARKSGVKVTVFKE